MIDPNDISHPIHELLKRLDSSINQLNKSVQKMDISSAELGKKTGEATEETKKLTRDIKKSYNFDDCNCGHKFPCVIIEFYHFFDQLISLSLTRSFKFSSQELPNETRYGTFKKNSFYH